MMSQVEYDELVEIWWIKCKEKYQRALAQRLIDNTLKALNPYISSRYNRATIASIKSMINTVHFEWVVGTTEFPITRLRRFNITLECNTEPSSFLRSFFTPAIRILYLNMSPELQSLYNGTSDLFVTNWYGNPEDDPWPMPKREPRNYYESSRLHFNMP